MYPTKSQSLNQQLPLVGPRALSADSRSKIRFFIDFANWTIHGIAVTTVDGEAKSYCNKSIEFDQSLISPLIEDLTLAWTNDHANSPATNKLWKFEWLKHGSCGLDINPINTEFKYFSKGIKSEFLRSKL